MLHGRRVVVVLPAYRAARTLARVHREIPQDVVDGMILVDDASDDNTVVIAKQLGIRTFGFFIVGLPGDTVQTVLESIRFAIGLRPTWVQFNAASPLMGTPLRTWALSRGLATDEEYSYRTSHEATMGNENLTKDQVAALQKFALFFERYLMNRGGVFKDERRKDWLYRLAHATADSVALFVARTVYAIGATYFVRAYALPAPARVRAAD